MTIRLRKVAQHAASHWIELFSKQTHIIAAREQVLEQLARFCITTNLRRKRHAGPILIDALTLPR